MIVNVHARRLPAGVEQVGAMLETLASAQDAIWRTRLVEPITLDSGLHVGSRGGHGRVRYTLTAHEPGRLVRFRFARGFALRGLHQFEVLADTLQPGEYTILRHSIEARPMGAGHVLWPVLIKPIHDAAVEEMLDLVEAQLAGSTRSPSGCSPWVRVMASLARGRHVAPRQARPSALLRHHLPAIDAADCWATPRHPAESEDPLEWARALLGRAPRWVSALMAMRNAVVAPLGLAIPRGSMPETGFPLVASSDREAVLGLDDSHLDFRVSVEVDAAEVRVLTAVHRKNWLGRCYWALVRHLHPIVVRGMIRSSTAPAASGARKVGTPG